MAQTVFHDKPRSYADLRAVRVPLLLASVALSLTTLAFWYMGDDLPNSLDNLQLQSDENMARFSSHCGSPNEGTEGVMHDDMMSTGQHPSFLQLRGAVVLAVPGDTSAFNAWPGDSGTPVVFNCEPPILPKQWPLNNAVDFKVADMDGYKVERSFDPDLLPPIEARSEEEFPIKYPCGPGQLTGGGFRQAVTLGRRLLHSYGALVENAIGSKALQVRSIDAKPALASAVGTLMALLTTPKLAQQFGRGNQLSIVTETNASKDMLRLSDQQVYGFSRAGQDLSKLELGDHLLARWCHQLAWPCRGSSCVTVEEAADIIHKGEAEVCIADPKLPGKQSRTVAKAAVLLQELKRLLTHSENSFSLLMSEGQLLGAVMQLLVGPTACSDYHLARPPVMSRLAVERWSASEMKYWRILYNGADLTLKMPGCKQSAEEFSSKWGFDLGGCEENIIAAFFDTNISK